MQVNQTKSEGLKHAFSIVVPASDIQSKMDARLQQLSKTAKLPGFRPGKVPVSLMKKRYGPSVLGEILEGAVNESSQKVINDNNLRPVMQPKIEITNEDFTGEQDLEYTMEVENFPDFEPVDFKTIKVERLKAIVPDTEVDEALQRIADANKSTEPSKSKAKKIKKGDFAVIDFLGKVDGEPFEGGKAEDYKLEIGSNTFIPGFEDQLVGAKADEELDVTVTFPEDYGAEHLAGKEAVFECKVKEIHVAADAKIDDELATKLGMEDLEALKKVVREQQEGELAGFARQHVKKNLLDALADAHDFELPESLVENEFESIWKQFEDARTNNPDAIEEEDKDKSDDELKTEYQEIANRRVRLGLLLAEVGRLNNIEVTNDEMNQAMMAEARKYPGQEMQVLEFMKQNPQAVEGLRAPVFEDKVVDFILELADVSEKEVSPEELMKAPEDADTTAKKKAAPKKKAAAKKKPAAKKAAADEKSDDE